MIYSSHTFEIKLNVKKEKFKKLFSESYENAKKNKHRLYCDYSFTVNKKPRTSYTDEALKPYGITLKYQDDFYKKSIKFIVNPSKILGGDDLDLWKPNKKNIQKLLKKLENHIKDYFHGEYKLKDFKMTRIDFTININVGSRENVSAYIRTFHNMGKVDNFSMKYAKNDTLINKDLSFDLTGVSNGIDFTVYDKERQSERKEAKGILRVEIRLTKQVAVNKYTDKKKISDKIEGLTGRSKEIFLDIFKKIIPRGDHYRLKKSKNLVEKNVPEKHLKEKMIKLLELIPKKKSLLLAQKTLDYRYFDTIMKSLRKLTCRLLLSASAAKRST